MARDIALAAIERRIPDQSPQIRWQFAYRHWFYMPLMHSEDMRYHDMVMQAFRMSLGDISALAEVTKAGNLGANDDEYRANAAKVVQKNVGGAKKFLEELLDVEQRHYNIIKRFGRYPHRNTTLGREPTSEEEDYLKNGGETFNSHETFKSH